jgi:hypothetical protein
LKKLAERPVRDCRHGRRLSMFERDEKKFFVQGRREVQLIIIFDFCCQEKNDGIREKIPLWI